MDAKQMLRSCEAALKQLQQLEGLLAHVPKKDAAKFVYQSITDVKELASIARLETHTNVTSEQALHINRIINRTAALLRLVPEDIQREQEDGAT